MPDIAYISVVIPTLGQKGVFLTERCVSSLREHHKHLGHDSFEIILVEDSQDPQVITNLENIGERFACKVVSQPNGGFAKACNHGLKLSNGLIIFLVNNDVEFLEPSLQAMASASNATGAALIGCRLLYPDLKIQHGGVVFVPNENTEGPLGYFDHIARFQEAYHPSAYSMRVSLVTGALMGITRWAIDVCGYLDERFLFTAEDIDYNLRVIEAGSEPLYMGYTAAIHHEGATRGRTLEEKMQLAPDVAKQEMASLDFFFQKWQGVDWEMFSVHSDLGQKLKQARLA